MKKRILALLLVASMAVTMIGCGSKGSEGEAKGGNKTEDNGGAVSAEKNLFDVKVTLPASFFEGEDMSNIETEAKAKGIHEVEINEDGSVIYTMDKKTHKELLSSVKQGVDEGIKETLEDKEKFPSFTEITYNDDLTEFNVMVDSSSYGGFQSFVALTYYMSGNMYQAMNGQAADKIKTIVNFKDKDSGEIIESADSSEMGNTGE